MKKWFFSLVWVGLFQVVGWAQTVSVVPSATAYVPTGGTVSFTVTLTYAGAMSAVGFQIGSVPAGWSFVSAGGNNPPGIVPSLGSTSAFEFAYTSIPASPISFSITAAYPAGLVGNQIFSGVVASFRPGSLTVSGANIVLTPSTAVGLPAITRQPVGAVLTQGDSYLMAVEASGSAPLSYQWRKDSVPLTGATTASLALSSLKAADAAAYSVVVTNSQGAATSAAAVIAVVAAAIAPSFASTPRAQSATAGTEVTFAVVVEGTAPFTYQWLRGGQTLAGATGATLTLRNVQKTDEGSYGVAVSNPGGTGLSPAAALTVVAGATAPTLTVQPVAQSAALGDRVSFSVVAAGLAPLSYQWKFNGVAITGATATTLPVPNVQNAHYGAYSVVVSNAAGSVSSLSVPLSALARAVAPVVATQPRAQSATAGTEVTFAVVVEGTAPFTYQWLRGGQTLAGATGATLTLRNVQKTEEGSYAVAVSNPGGTGLSSAAALTVVAGATAPTLTVQPVAQSAALGDRVSFSVVAAGLAPLSYQWKFNGVAITGATATTWPVANVQNVHYGAYSVVVSNAAGSVSSLSVPLSALASGVAPVVATQPVVQSVEVGASASFGVVATGTAPLAYQWKQAGQNIAGASNATLTLANVQTLSGGAYTVVVTNAFGAVTSAAAVLTVSVAAPTPVSRLANLSVRSLAGAGEQTLIVGFAVGGTGVKSILLRGVGPTLAQFGLSGALADPQLRLFNSAGAQTELNDDWGGGGPLVAAFSAVGAFGLSATSRDAALLIPVGGGAYTAQVTGAGGAGMALLEVYDSDAGGSTARLTNLSARTQVGTGDNILVVGFVVRGTAPKTLLLRGVGPGLLAFGVSGVLADPQLKLFNAAGALVSANDDWGGAAALAAAFTQTGAFGLPTASSDAVLLSTLPAGAYTLQISGANATSGIALAEVYELP